MKYYTKTVKIVENFTEPIAFLRKSVILGVYSEGLFPKAYDIR